MPVADVAHDGWAASLRRGWRWLPVAAVGLVAACNLSARAMAWRLPTSGPLWQGVVPLGALPLAVPESSGLVASLRTEGVYWTHNDSGHEPAVYAIDETGGLLQTVAMPGVPDRDWEALGAGPCPAGQCLYVGDVGDNLGQRDLIHLLRLAEPAVARGAASAPARIVAPFVEVLAIRLPDRPRDVEALYVAPDTSVWLITKRPDWFTLRGSPARMYRVPAAAWQSARRIGASRESDRPDGPPAAVITAEPAGRLPVTPGRYSAREWITDASLSPPVADGSRLLAVLTYGTLYVFEADRATGRPGKRVGRCRLPIPEHDPEAVTWRPDGRLLLTNEGAGSTIYAGRCP